MIVRKPHPLHLLYSAERGAVAPQGAAVCYVCGYECPPVPRNLPPAFMNLDRCEGRGDSMCDACRSYFSAGRTYLLWGSVLITSTAVRKLDQAGLASVLLEEPWPAESYVLAVSAAKQKQVIPWSPVNAARSDPRIYSDQWGEIAWDRETLAPVREAFRWLYHDAGFSKQAILDDQYAYLPVFAKRGGDLRQWQAHRDAVRPWLGSAELQLISYITPSKQAARKD